MHVEKKFLFGQCLILYHHYIFAIARPIIGNNVRNAESDEFPFVVSVLRINGTMIIPERDVICSGTLVTQDDVLTSEHCVDNISLSGIQIIIGSPDLLQARKYYPAWWISFDQWSVKNREPIKYSDNDVLMIRLSETVPEQNYASQLSTIPANRLYNLETQIAGWGITNNGSISRFLQTANVRTLSSQICEARISNITGKRIAMEERFVCSAAEPYILLHLGDSGGPLLHRGLIIGINKGTCPLLNGEFHPGKVNIHFAIEEYEEFILDVENYF